MPAPSNAPAAEGRARLSGEWLGHDGLVRAFAFALAGAALSLTVLRLLDLGTAPFIQDEPAIQLMLDDHLAAHTLPTHGVMGTKGLVYGPTAAWLYMPVRLFTDDVTWIIAMHAALQCIGLVLLFLAIRASAGKDTALWTWLLVAASPYLFFYARLAWDNTFLVPLVALVLFLLVYIERRPGGIAAWTGLGVVLGLIFDLHLMALPVIAAAVITLAPIALQARRSPRVGVGVLLATVAAGSIATPYLREVSSALRHGSQFALTQEGFARVLPETLQTMRRYSSAEGMEYFLGQSFAPVVSALGPLGWAFALDWVVALAAAGSLFLTTGRLIHAASRGGWQMASPMPVRFGVVFFWLLLLYYWGVAPSPFHPHYAIACFWLLPFFAVWSLRHLPPWARAILQGTIGLLVIGDAAFVLRAHALIARNHGTRGDHYGSIPAQVRTAARDICRATRGVGQTLAVVDLRRVPSVLPLPLRWFDHHVADCANIELSFSDGGRRPSDPVFRLAYGEASPDDASLRVIAVRGVKR